MFHSILFDIVKIDYKKLNEGTWHRLCLSEYVSYYNIQAAWKQNNWITFQIANKCGAIYYSSAGTVIN